MGVRGTLEVPGRVRLVASGGVLPPPYLEAMNEVLIARGRLDPHAARLIEDALEDALVLRFHLGWRPAPQLGLQLETGYSWVGLGGDTTAVDVLYVKTKTNWDPYLDKSYRFGVDAAMHRVEASVGYALPLGRHALLRCDLGWSHTVSATARVAHEFAVPWYLEDAVDDIEESGEDVLVETLEEKVHTPMLSVGLGWRGGG